VMEVTRAGGGVGIPGLYVTGDPGAVDEKAKIGMLSIRIGLGWAKSHTFATGQCPVMKYHRQLMNAILYDKIQIAKAVNVTTISLDEAWEFFLSPENLKKITPPYMGFEITSNFRNEKMYAGMIIAYIVKPVLNIPIRWVT